MRVQVRQGGDTVIFHMLRAPLKIHNNYGRKPTFPCFLQQMSQWATGLGRETLSPQQHWIDWVSVQRGTWDPRGLSAHLCFRSLFQTRLWDIHPAHSSWTAHPWPSSHEDYYENRDFRDTLFPLQIQSLVTHHPLGHRPVETHVLKNTHLPQCFWL